MKRVFLVTAAAFVLLTPGFAAASDAPRLVYRHELRAFVPVSQPARTSAPASSLTPAETVARHEAMARGHRVNPRGNAAAAAHCERVVTQAVAMARHAN